MKFQINKEQIQQYFHLPLEEAAVKLGCCSSVLKRTCRQLGIKRWPYRRMKSLSKRQSQLQQQLTTLHDQYMKNRKQLEDVEGEMDVIIKEELSGVGEDSIIIEDDGVGDFDAGETITTSATTTPSTPSSFLYMNHAMNTNNNLISNNASSSSNGMIHNNQFPLTLPTYSSSLTCSTPPTTLSSSSLINNNHNNHSQQNIQHTSSLSYVSQQPTTPSSSHGGYPPHMNNQQQHASLHQQPHGQLLGNNNNNGNSNLSIAVNTANHRTTSNNGDPMMNMQSMNNIQDTLDVHPPHVHSFNNNACVPSHVNQHQHHNNTKVLNNSWNNDREQLPMHANNLWSNSQTANSNNLDPSIVTPQYNNINSNNQCIDPNEQSMDASVHESINTADYTTRGRGGYSFPNRHQSPHHQGSSPNRSSSINHVEPCFRPLISTMDGVNVNAALTNDRGLLMWFSKGLQETLPSYFNTQAVNKDYKKDETFKGSTIDVYESFYRRRATHGTIRMIQCFFDRYVVVDCHGVMLNHYSASPSAGSHYMWYLHVRKETDFSAIASFFNPSQRDNKALQFGVAYTFQLEE